MEKPTLFIASSKEGLAVADAINANLEHETHCTLWRNGTFKLSSQTVDDLVKKSATIDFAVFVFTPDDLATIRKQEEMVARDNVVFELGLFIGGIGKDRCYVVKPRGVHMHLPSDLLGMNTADFEPDRPDRDIASALNYACTQIKARIKELGPLPRSSFVRSPPAHLNANPPDYKLQDVDLQFLAQCVKSKVSEPQGLAFYSIQNELTGESDHAVMMSAIKLDRLGYIEKTAETDNQGYNEHFAYRATDDGLDAFLKHEERFISMRAERVAATAANRRGGYSRPPAPTPKKSSGFDDIDDEIPF